MEGSSVPKDTWYGKKDSYEGLENLDTFKVLVCTLLQFIPRTIKEDKHSYMTDEEMEACIGDRVSPRPIGQHL